MDFIERTIYIKQKRLILPIPYVQGTNAVFLRFFLADYTASSGAEARIYIKKPSGKEIYNQAILLDKVIAVTPTTQMFAEAGEYPGQIQIVKGDSILVSFTIPFQVERNLISESAVESTNEYGILDGLIQDARSAIKDMEDLIDQVETKLEDGDFIGPKGDTGEDGATWLFGTSVPLSSAGKNGDFYLQTNTYDIYQKSSGSWTKKGNIKGATGSKGDTGAAATVKVGTVTTGEPGTEAKVTNSGSSGAAVLNFTIPRGNTGDIENLDTATIEFEQSSSRINILKTDTLKVILGKIQKYFTDLKTVAFSGKYSDLSGKPTIPTIVNDLINVSSTSGLSSKMGKQLADWQGDLKNLETNEQDSLVGAINELTASIKELTASQGQIGMTGVISATRNAISTYKVTFPKAFSKTPRVVACFYSGSGTLEFYKTIMSVHDISTTGFTIRVYNGHAEGFSPNVVWFAKEQE